MFPSLFFHFKKKARSGSSIVVVTLSGFESYERSCLNRIKGVHTRLNWEAISLWDVNFVATDWLKPSEMHSFDFCQKDIRAVCLCSGKMCYTGVGKGFVAFLNNLHNWQIIKIKIICLYTYISYGFSWKVNQPIRIQAGY